ncbi:sugar ABC transporter ATP-binding protein [Conexibacter sp. DBS9H8]|uniref:sugar ABC transporter ATP-binding protein n=1 Tax=Conexibacter sp. DBS9H8 TaxID=2937801 RepID=UPI00200C5398|nr:sugar ABC transporter ATP-binding protein [Conexibacter sp. DBS9H8]
MREPATASDRLALKIRGVAKTFPGVRALVDFDLDVRAGSVHALLGHNGCGKSTLIKALAGVHAPDPGAKAWIDDEPLEIGDAVDAQLKGLRFVHQELGIIPEMGAVDNVGFVLGFQRGRFGRIDWRAQARVTTELLERFGFKLDPHKPLAAASPPERAAVAIVRAVAGWKAGRGVLILDEPTAALPAHEVDELFRLVREVSGTGTAVILVSHRLDEVMAIADHATVMRSGAKVWDGPLSSTSLSGLVDLISNTEASDSTATAGSHASGHRVRNHTTSSETPIALEARGMYGRYLRGVSFRLRVGEVLGVAGLLGSGREELPYLIGGNQRSGAEGAVSVDGRESRCLTVTEAHELGIVLVPADRAREGIFADFTTRENVSLAALPTIALRGLFTPPAEKAFVSRWLNAVHADPGFSERLISTLSGGNQQKAILARWLSVGPKVLLLSEPTAGVDIGARNVIYQELRQRAADGLAILMASSDVEDLLASCDRVIVLRDGVIAGEFAGDHMTKAAIAYAMEGAHSEHG